MNLDREVGSRDSLRPEIRVSQDLLNKLEQEEEETGRRVMLRLITTLNIKTSSLKRQRLK